MFLDAVLNAETHEVVFNGTPEDTKNFLKHFEPSLRDEIYAMDGASLTRWTIEEYLAR